MIVEFMSRICSKRDWSSLFACRDNNAVEILEAIRKELNLSAQKVRQILCSSVDAVKRNLQKFFHETTLPVSSSIIVG